MTQSLFEFLRGATNVSKYEEKKEILNNIIDVYLPVAKDVYDNVFTLIKKFGIEGKGMDMTDLLLGGVLMQYPNKLFLFTKNTTDFPTNIYKFVSVFNLPQTKSIQTYGVYTYAKNVK